MKRLGGLLGLARLRLLLLAPSREPLFLVAVVRDGLFLVLLTLVAIEEQNFLRIAGTHTDSFRSWRAVVQRITVFPDA